MASNSAENGGVFIVDFALNKAVAKSMVIFSGWDERFPIYRWIEDSMRKSEFGEDLSLAKLVQRLARELLDDFSQQDEADVAVFGAGSRIGGQRDLQRLA
jgi:hypothetical protein